MIREYIVKISDEVMENDAELFKNPPILVRCKDCKYAKKWDVNTIRCRNNSNDLNAYHRDNWFCADGEPETH